MIASTNLTICFMTQNKNVILPTAMIYIQTRKGNFIQGRTLIDSCSQINCLTFDLAKQLGFKKTRVCAPVSGLNGT